MAVSKHGKVKDMPIGTVRYAMKMAEKSGNTNSAYYDSLKARMSELGFSR